MTSGKRGKLEHAARSGVTIDDVHLSIGTGTMKKWVAVHPVTFGVLISIVVATTIIGMNTWFPRIAKAFWDTHNTLVQAIWFTAALFGALVSHLWRLRLRGAISFWASLFALLILHAVGILICTSYFGPLPLRQWVSIIVCEAFIGVFVVDWATRRFGHSSRHEYH
jgi:hypothetical protein